MLQLRTMMSIVVVMVNVSDKIVRFHCHRRYPRRRTNCTDSWDEEA